MDRLRPRVRTVRHVLLLGLGVASQEDAGYAVAQENGHRAVVGLRVEFAGRRGDDVCDRLLQSARYGSGALNSSMVDPKQESPLPCIGSEPLLPSLSLLERKGSATLGLVSSRRMVLALA